MVLYCCESYVILDLLICFLLVYLNLLHDKYQIISLDDFDLGNMLVEMQIFSFVNISLLHHVEFLAISLIAHLLLMIFEKESLIFRFSFTFIPFLIKLTISLLEFKL